MPPINEWPTFVHGETFDADWAALGLGDDDLSRLQVELVNNPAAGDVVRGTGGLRKYRLAPPGRGKSGGARVGYAVFPAHGLILLLLVYEKSQKADLTAAERKAVAKLLKAFGAALDAD
ncbi:MAG: type II toxin-antitoxin system RelE/ParE family toxin [Gemmataceae bacterium]|nr:type II toxin-antitoxin system RelE/ParE family toxin [Gemmataceae bacterium]